jgi:hypothetical protein
MKRAPYRNDATSRGRKLTDMKGSVPERAEVTTKEVGDRQGCRGMAIGKRVCERAKESTGKLLSRLFMGHLTTLSVARLCSFEWMDDRQTHSVALVRKRTIPTELPPLVGEVSANFSG